MNQSSDEDQDSLFGSPPPSPVRGRSPSQESFIQGEGVGPVIVTPIAGVRRKNVGTIALPGSHMSCAELPADLPALSLLLPRPKSSHDSPCTASPSVAGTPTSIHTQTVTSRSTSRSVCSRASSAVSAIPSTSTSASTRKRRTSKAKSRTPASPAPPITLPGPNEPTPPNFLRSQSSLLGLAGLVGSVKPSRLYTHGPQPPPTQQHLPRGSTPTHPIMVDDDQDAPHTGERPRSQGQMPQRLDQLDPEILRLNIMNSLTKEKNIFPVLESLIQLFGAEPHAPSASPLPHPFARPYGHGIFNVQATSPTSPIPAGDSTAPTVPPPKRRKLKHVPAGAADWDIPFPFAAGEGPKGYRDTWAQDRAKQLTTQLLELVQNATKRAAIRTAKGRRKSSEGRARAQNRQSSRSASVETQPSNSTRIREHVSHVDSSLEGTVTGTPGNVTPVDSLSGSSQPLGVIGLPAPDFKDRISVNSEGAIEEGGSASPCDLAAFEEWLAQLQQLVPLDTNASTPESDWATCSSLSLGSTFTPSIHSPSQCDALSTSNAIQDEAIDPTLLAISQLGDIPRVLDICSISTPPTLTHSPRTSLSSLTEPLTPPSEAFADVPMSVIAHQDHDHDPHVNQPVEKDPRLRSLLTELFEPLGITSAQKGKARADVSVAPATPSTLDQSTPGVVSTHKGVFDRQAILERARERRRQLVAEIERAKLELWETSIENAVLVHLTRDGTLGS